MKICHISTVHPFDDNRIFYKECKTLKNHGFDVCLLIAGCKESVFEGIQFHSIPKSKNRFIRIIVTSIFHVLNKEREIKADIYHLHDPELMIAGLILRLMSKKVIFDVHENTPAAMLSKPYLKYKWIQKFISRIIGCFEKFCFRFGSAIITARPDISERLQTFKPVTLRNFPILPAIGNILPIQYEKKAFTIIYVGRMSGIRGIIELFNALEYIDNVELWLLGDFSSSEFQKECESHRYWGTKIVYFGKVKPDEIFSYIVKADVGITTFLPYPNHLKTLATKPFEYMVCGLPMILSDFPYWREFFQDCALYVNPNDSKDIADKIKLIKANDLLMVEMGEKNKYLVMNEYNWEIESIRLLEIYKKIAV